MARLVRCFATAAWLPACCRCMAMQAGGRWLHPGDAALPPLVEVPGAPLTLLERIVKPPDAETLYEWQTTHGREEDPDPSWASVWPAAAALSARIAEAPQIVRGHSVIELGSGLGVVALTAAAAGAANVTLVDREPLALHCAMSTAALNGLTTAAIADTDQAPGTVRAAVCSWADTPSMLSQGAAVIVGSEVLYDPSCVEELASCVATLLQRAGGGHLLLAEPHKERAPGCRSALCARLVELGASEVREEPLSALETAGGGAEPLVLLEATFNPRRSASSGQPAAPAATCASDPKPPRMSCARRSVTAVAGVLASALSVSLFGGHVPRALWTLPAAAAPEPTSAAAAETAAGMAAETAAEGTGVTDASEYVERAAADLGAETARVTIEKLGAPPEGGCALAHRAARPPPPPPFPVHTPPLLVLLGVSRHTSVAAQMPNGFP